MYQIDEIVQAKKTHACGGSEFTIIRVGADYKIKCNTCGRILLVDKTKLDKMVKNKK